MHAKTPIEVDEHVARQNLRLIEALEDLDDVQRVTANFDLPDEVLAELPPLSAGRCTAMIVLGIDPGHAATGYGIVEREGSQAASASTTAACETLPTQELPRRLLEIHQRRDGADRDPQAGRSSASSGSSSTRTSRPRSPSARHAAWFCLPRPSTACPSSSTARTRSRWRSRATAAPTRARSSAWSRRCWACPCCPGRTTPRTPWPSQSASRTPARRPPDGRHTPRRDRFRRGPGSRARARFGRRRRPAASATGSSAGRARSRRSRRAPTHGSTPTTSCARTSQALYGFRTTEELGFFELLTTVTGVGPKVALGDRFVAAGRRSAAGHPPGRRGCPDGRIGRRQEARRADRARAQGKGVRGGRRRARWESCGIVGVGGGAALQALGYTASEAREAARGAVAALPVGASLEERVKAALASCAATDSVNVTNWERHNRRGRRDAHARRRARAGRVLRLHERLPRHRQRRSPRPSQRGR